ncbi:hypothetical protein BD309DRAFT_906021, partial [Dichomitus squalens]
MAEPPRKRTRLDASSGDLPTCSDKPGRTRRDEEFWFEDRNVIFVAEDTEFCVYKGPLSKHSAVFKYMISLPQPAAASADEPPVIEELVRQVADHLLSHYFPTYEAYAAITVEDNIPGFDLSIHHIAVVNLTRLSDTPSLLQSALFACCGIPPSRLVQGFEREDGVQEQPSLDDLIRVLVGRAELTKLDAEAAVAIFRP